jgi:hypothetical protein
MNAQKGEKKEWDKQGKEKDASNNTPHLTQKRW